MREYLSYRAVEYAENMIGEDVQLAAIVVPPIPRDRVEEVVDEYDDEPVFDNPIAGHLYDLTDIALAVNHSGDPMLDHSVEADEEPYDVTRESIREIKVARGALMSAFNRELAACAERLDIDADQDDLVEAIRDELDYEVDVEISEEFTELEDENDD